MSEIVSLSGEKLESQEKQDAEKAKAAEELLAKQEELEKQWKEYQEKLEANRVTTTEEVNDIVARVNTIMQVISAETHVAKTELQNRELPDGSKQRIPVPVASFPVNLLESHGLRQEKAVLVDRALELIMKL